MNTLKNIFIRKYDSTKGEKKTKIENEPTLNSGGKKASAATLQNWPEYEIN